MTPFDVVIVPFPFTDLRKTKKRPCLILTSVKPQQLPPHYILAMMTSNLAGLSFPGDVFLKDWAKAQLPKETLIRLAKVVTVDETIIEKKIGTLSRTDAKSVAEHFQKLYPKLLS